eukprot:1345623-Amphidinium_carterae.1
MAMKVLLSLDEVNILTEDRTVIVKHGQTTCEQPVSTYLRTQTSCSKSRLPLEPQPSKASTCTLEVPCMSSPSKGQVQRRSASSDVTSRAVFNALTACFSKICDALGSVQSGEFATDMSSGTVKLVVPKAAVAVIIGPGGA